MNVIHPFLCNFCPFELLNQKFRRIDMLCISNDKHVSVVNRFICANNTFRCNNLNLIFRKRFSHCSLTVQYYCYLLILFVVYLGVFYANCLHCMELNDYCLVFALRNGYQIQIQNITWEESLPKQKCALTALCTLTLLYLIFSIPSLLISFHFWMLLNMRSNQIESNFD